MLYYYYFLWIYIYIVVFFLFVDMARLALAGRFCTILTSGHPWRGRCYLMTPLIHVCVQQSELEIINSSQDIQVNSPFFSLFYFFSKGCFDCSHCETLCLLSISLSGFPPPLNSNVGWCCRSKPVMHNDWGERVSILLPIISLIYTLEPPQNSGFGWWWVLMLYCIN